MEQHPIAAPGPTAVRIHPGVVDVVVLAPAPARTRAGARWRILTLRRAAGTRCTGAWELVHGRVEAGERPEAAALREVREETGLAVTRLYSITVHPFYLPRLATVELAMVFAAIVDAPGAVTFGAEHDAYAWRAPVTAARRVAWPREREAIRHAMELLRTGDAGAVEDVLRVEPRTADGRGET
jgi:8-oxo-dGTP pyrophosphatase MutT (NUDIX family)